MISSIHNNGYQSDKTTSRDIESRDTGSQDTGSQDTGSQDTGSQDMGSHDTEYDAMNSSSLLVQIDSSSGEEQEKRSRSRYKHSANKIEMSSSREYDSIGIDDISIHTNLQSSASDIRSYFKPWNEAIRDVEDDDNCSMNRDKEYMEIKREMDDSCYVSCLYLWKRCVNYVLCKNGFYKIEDHDGYEE